MASPTSSHLYLYLSNWHANMLKYDDCSSSFRLWYLELAYIRDKYFVFVSFGKHIIEVRPLWTGHVGAWLILAGPKHNLIFPLCSGINTELLHHSVISSMPNGVMMSCRGSHSSFSFIQLLGGIGYTSLGASYSLHFSLVYNENSPSKHPLPVNISLKFSFLCAFCTCSFVSFLLEA